jgi:phage major head subunit gpT-like protein
MEINAANLNALYITFDTIFQRGFEKPPSYYDKIATVTRSASAQTLYPFLGRTTKFSEWLDERHMQALERHGYTITNKHFENTVKIDRNDLEDDQYGTYEPMIEQLGIDTKVHPDTLLFTMLKNATSNIDSPSAASAVVGYDGKTFFSSTGHPVGPQNNASDDSNVANIDTGGSGAYWFLIDCSRAIRPFIFQIRKEYQVTRMNAETDEAVFMKREFRYGVDGRVNVGVGLWQLAYASNQDLSNPAKYGAAISAMKSIKTDAGLPFGALNNRKGIYLLVPPSLEEVARQLLNSEFMAGVGSSSSVPTTNIWRNSADLIVSEYLA